MVMVIGGYGEVGKFVSRQVKNVVVAGRNKAKADNFIRMNEIQGISRVVDTNNLKKENFEDIDTVIMCVECNNRKVIEACMNYHMNYIDISPSYEILSLVEALRERIEQSGIVCVIGVGIAPGISNLLCKEAARGMSQVDEIESYLMLGIGDSHGSNAVLWFLKHIYCSTNGIDSFAEKKKIFLNRTRGREKQMVTRIDLADWHIMQQEYPTAKCSSWFAYDIDWVTKMICFMKKLGFYKSLIAKENTKREKATSRLQKLFHMELSLAKSLHIGTDEYVTQVRVIGIKEGRRVEKELFVNGYSNSKITARAAVNVSRRIYQRPSGLYYIDQVLELDEIKAGMGMAAN